MYDHPERSGKLKRQKALAPVTRRNGIRKYRELEPLPRKLRKLLRTFKIIIDTRHITGEALGEVLLIAAAEIDATLVGHLADQLNHIIICRPGDTNQLSCTETAQYMIITPTLAVRHMHQHHECRTRASQRFHNTDKMATIIGSDVSKILVTVINDHDFARVFSLLLAAWFTDNRLKLKCQGFFKTVIYMPNLIMASAFAMLFFALFADQGPVNNRIQALGGEPIRFLSNIWGTRSLVALMNFLMWFGNTTIILMAAMMGISPSMFTSRWAVPAE